MREASSRSQTVFWLIAVLLAFIAGGLWRGDRPAAPLALAQAPPMAGARGVYAFTGPIGRNRYGLFMLDIEQGTVWCYAIETIEGVPRLRLIAARTWIYDRYLRDYNSAPPDFRTVRDLVARQRELQTQPTKENPAPTGGQPPGP